MFNRDCQEKGGTSAVIIPVERLRSSQPRLTGAFTLVELMVVVLIIGILAGLLSTAFSNTKSKSRRIICMNNLRQLQVAWRTYIEDNDDFMPLNRSTPTVNERIFGRRNSSNSWVVGSPKEDVSSANIVKGTLFPYTRNVQIYHCPEDQSKVRRDMLRTRSYSMSAFLNGDDVGIDPRVKVKESELINPSPGQIFVFVEEHEFSAWLGSFRVLPRERYTLASGTWTSTPSDRHNQGCNITFADTHVEYWKWFWPKRSNLQSKLTSNGQDFRDLRKLQEAVPKP